MVGPTCHTSSSPLPISRVQGAQGRAMGSSMRRGGGGRSLVAPADGEQRRARQGGGTDGWAPDNGGSSVEGAWLGGSGWWRAMGAAR